MKSFYRNTLVSVFTTALDLAVLTSLVELAHVDYRIATFLGTVVGALSNFIINRSWSFGATHVMPHWQLLRFVPVQIGSSALHTLGVWLFTAAVGLPYFGSKIVVATLVYLIWNYPMNRYFVFQTSLSRAKPARTSTPAA